MDSPPPKPVREDAAPFLVQLFFRQGGFYRPDEFGAHSLPSHVSIYTWSDCTLKELALELAAAKPSAIPTPAVGTRLAFQLVFPDLRSTSAVNNSQTRFAVRDLGSIVIGEGQPGAEVPNDSNIDGHGATKGIKDKDKTLSDARFVVGDYVSCAILPPLSDGSIAPASGVRREQAMPPREGRGGYRGGFQDRENGFGRGGFRGGGGRGGWRDNVGGGFPTGEWRRGERLPDGPGPGSGPRPRGRGRW